MRKSFKAIIRLSLTLLTAGMLVVTNAGGAITAMASEAPVADSDPVNTGKEYDFTVRIFGGDKGTINGSQVEEHHFNKGDNFYFSLNDVNVTNNKYYPKKLRESGRDVNETSMLNFTVDRDYDLVVSYGISGKTASYTVYYQDQAGNNLFEPETLYGNDLDKVIVGAKELDGFLPNTYNYTGTIYADRTNTFTFVYTPNEGTVTVIDEGVIDEGTAVAGGAAAGGAAAGGAAAGGAAAGGAAAGGAAAGGAAAGGAAAGGAAAGGAEGGGAAGPAQVIDIDEGAVPQAAGPGGTGTGTGTEGQGGEGTGTEGQGGEGTGTEGQGGEGTGTENIDDNKTPTAGVSTIGKIGIFAIIALLAAIGIALFLRNRTREGE